MNKAVPTIVIGLVLLMATLGPTMNEFNNFNQAVSTFNQQQIVIANNNMSKISPSGVTTDNMSAFNPRVSYLSYDENSIYHMYTNTIFSGPNDTIDIIDMQFDTNSSGMFYVGHDIIETPLTRGGSQVMTYLYYGFTTYNDTFWTIKHTAGISELIGFVENKIIYNQTFQLSPDGLLNEPGRHITIDNDTLYMYTDNPIENRGITQYSLPSLNYQGRTETQLSQPIFDDNIGQEVGETSQFNQELEALDIEDYRFQINTVNIHQPNSTIKSILFDYIDPMDNGYTDVSRQLSNTIVMGDYLVQLPMYYDLDRPNNQYYFYKFVAIIPIENLQWSWSWVDQLNDWKTYLSSLIILVGLGLMVRDRLTKTKNLPE